MILFDTSVLSRVFRRRRPGAEEQRLRGVFEELMASSVPLGMALEGELGVWDKRPAL